MSRTVLWYIGAALFLIAGIAAAIGSQWVWAAAAVAIAMALLVLGIRESRKNTTGTRL